MIRPRTRTSEPKPRPRNGYPRVLRYVHLNCFASVRLPDDNLCAPRDFTRGHDSPVRGYSEANYVSGVAQLEGLRCVRATIMTLTSRERSRLVSLRE